MKKESMWSRLARWIRSLFGKNEIIIAEDGSRKVKLPSGKRRNPKAGTDARKIPNRRGIRDSHWNEFPRDEQPRA